MLFARDGQALPHPPQFAGSLALLTSHPSVARTLQSWKAPLQLNPQVPDTQVVVALVRAGQALPQAPQLELSVAEYTSQPFTVFASQLRKAPVQLIPQAPPAHVGLELARVGHTVPHEPQFERFVAPSISHPSAPTVLQSRNGDWQKVPQVEDVQADQAWGALPHSVPHSPQFVGSYRGSTQRPLHGISGDSHVGPQLPPEHTWPAPQSVPQVPQFRLSVCLFTHVPHWVGLMLTAQLR